MQEVILEWTPRAGAGKGVCRKARAAGRVPAVIYGHGVETPINITVDPKELGKALKTPWATNIVLTLKSGDVAHTVMCKEIQRNSLTRAIRHVDFMSPNPNKDVTVSVPLAVSGKALGMVAGGKLKQPFREVLVKTRPTMIPAEVPVDITPLDVNDTVMASQIKLGDGISVVYDRDYIVAKIVIIKGEGEGEGEEKKA